MISNRRRGFNSRSVRSHPQKGILKLPDINSSNIKLKKEISVLSENVNKSLRELERYQQRNLYSIGSHQSPFSNFNGSEGTADRRDLSFKGIKTAFKTFEITMALNAFGDVFCSESHLIHNTQDIEMFNFLIVHELLK